MIFVWMHEDAPQSLRDLGDGEWIATVPSSFDVDRISLFSASTFSVHPHPFLSGWKVLIGHAEATAQ